MEFIVQKAVELGVSRIVPYLSKNCVSRPDKTEKKVERWRKIAAEAAKQCGRGRLPEVAAVVPVAQAIAQAAESETALFFYENERRTGLRDALAGGVRDTVSLMVGPEGGFDPAEAKAAVDAGLQSVSLGTRILRCETAPIAALAAVLYAGGNHVRRNKGSVKHWQKTMWVKSQFLRKSIPPTRCSQYSVCACSACWY